MAERYRDVAYTFFMLIVAGISFADSLLSSIRYTVMLGGQSANLPLLMVFVSLYEIIMTLLLMNEIKRRNNNGNI
jgi:hypothetical protein